MKWFLLGVMCLASPNSPEMCRTFVYPATYEEPAACAEASKPLVGAMVAKFREKGLRRIKTYCALGEKNRDKVLEVLGGGVIPKLGKEA